MVSLIDRKWFIVIHKPFLLVLNIGSPPCFLLYTVLYEIIWWSSNLFFEETFQIWFSCLISEHYHAILILILSGSLDLHVRQFGMEPQRCTANLMAGWNQTKPVLDRMSTWMGGSSQGPSILENDSWPGAITSTCSIANRPTRERQREILDPIVLHEL